MVRPTDYAPIHLSLKEVTVNADIEVLMEVDNKSLLIVGDPQGSLGQQFRLCPIHLLNNYSQLLSY
jgi:hypothetical protein